MPLQKLTQTTRGLALYLIFHPDANTKGGFCVNSISNLRSPNTEIWCEVKEHTRLYNRCRVRDYVVVVFPFTHGLEKLLSFRFDGYWLYTIWLCNKILNDISQPQLSMCMQQYVLIIEPRNQPVLSVMNLEEMCWRTPPLTLFYDNLTHGQNIVTVCWHHRDVTI